MGDGDVFEVGKVWAFVVVNCNFFLIDFEA